MRLPPALRAWSGCLGSLCLLLVFGFSPARGGLPPEEVLREYVGRADESYRWVVRHRSQFGGCEVIELTLTSQTWRELVWQHRLFLIVPPNLPAETNGLLVIEGGSWKPSDGEPLKAGEKPYPKQALSIALYAQQMNCPIAVLLNVPRQPIFEGRKEDAIIALTFDEYLQNGQSDWPLLLPMVKSAVRAMDAVQAFAAEALKMKIGGFTVAGASKRGWTTWLTAAVDSRVRGLGPMVIDMLNIEAQFEHQLAAYGRLSERIHDYTERDLPRRMGGQAGAALRRIVDPYQYRQQISQPKMLFLGTNDGFWTVDSLNLYWEGLEGEKFIVYVPNADHDLARDWQRIMGGLRRLHRHVHGEQKLPQLQWRHGGGEDQPATLEIQTGGHGDGEVVKAYLWTAEAATRDFRTAKWSSVPLAVGAAGEAMGRVEPPASGYRALFADVVYGEGLLPLHLSTTIRVLQASRK